MKIFKKYNIHATWATVGALLAENEEEFLKYRPEHFAPQTAEMLSKLGIYPEKDTSKCPREMLFAPKLVKMVSETSGQEIGTHTFSHYYCDIATSSTDDFLNDINAAKAIMKDKGFECNSIVFPRNQVSQKYIEALTQASVTVYRGVESGWLVKAKKTLRKIGLLLWYGDNYIPVQKCQSYHPSEIRDGKLFNVRNTRFFKPYRPKYRLIEKLKVWRYKAEIRHAAKKGEVYHIYWHPHNFAEYTDINFAQMEQLLKTFKDMNERYGMTSKNMSELAMDEENKNG